MGTRDRHGRGLRSPLHMPDSPGYSTRKERFDGAVAERVGWLERRWGREWGRVDFAVEEVPPSRPAAWEHGVPLGRLFPAEPGLPARVVLYRRPIEQRADDTEDLLALIRDILVENVGHLLSLAPEDIDPDYGM
jgi:Zincin-like metallopeptidase